MGIKLFLFIHYFPLSGGYAIAHMNGFGFTLQCPYH